MTKKLSVLFILMLFVASLGFGQSIKFEAQKAKKIDPSTTVDNAVKSKVSAKVEYQGEGEQIGFTNYDYPTNGETNRQVELYDIDGNGSLDPVGWFMERISDADGSGTRNVMFWYVDEFGSDKFPVHNPADYCGWGQIQVITAGDYEGKAFVSYHFGGAGYVSQVYLDDLAADPLVGPVGGNFPSFAYKTTTNEMFMTTGNLRFNSDSPTGVFEEVDGVGVIDGVEQFGDFGDSEYPMHITKDETKLAIVGSFVGDGHYGVDEGVTEETADGFFVQSSADGGATWSFERISVDGLYMTYANRTNTFPILENFAQRRAIYDNTNVLHVVANGYSYLTDEADTVVGFSFPVAYWNDKNKEWIAVTDESTETEEVGNQFYPGNGLGQSYPTVAVSDDGMIVVVLYQGFEYSGDVGASDVNIYPGDGGDATLEVFFTDIYMTYSVDGGATFATPVVIAGQKEVQESFPMLAENLEVTAAKDMFNVKMNYIYYIDAVPGVSLFSENSESDDGYWVSENYEMQVEITGVSNEIVANEFKLEQNYPNPFNPTTTISYSVPEASLVTLKVYDVLGSEVATIVNENVQAGNHEVEFNASNLASGLYIYKIQSGNFVSSKKMMLLK